MLRCDFTGTLIVVPDVGALNLAGASAERGTAVPATTPRDSAASRHSASEI